MGLSPTYAKSLSLGEVHRHHTHLYIMFGRFFVYPLFRFLFGSCCCFLKNTKIPKIFLFFLLVCFFAFWFWFALKEKSKKILLCLFLLVCFCFVWFCFVCLF